MKIFTKIEIYDSIIPNITKGVDVLKKVLFLFSLLLTLSIPSVTGAEGKGDKVIDPYTGDEIGAFFEIGEDGQLIEKPVEELAQKLEESKRIEK